jgi:hypothetical protein
VFQVSRQSLIYLWYDILGFESYEEQCNSYVSIKFLSSNGQMRSLLGFAIDSFGIQNLILCFCDLGSCVLRSAVEVT